MLKQAIAGNVKNSTGEQPATRNQTAELKRRDSMLSHNVHVLKSTFQIKGKNTFKLHQVLRFFFEQSTLPPP